MKIESAWTLPEVVTGGDTCTCINPACTASELQRCWPTRHAHNTAANPVPMETEEASLPATGKLPCPCTFSSQHAALLPARHRQSRRLQGQRRHPCPSLQGAITKIRTRHGPTLCQRQSQLPFQQVSSNSSSVPPANEEPAERSGHLYSRLHSAPRTLNAPPYSRSQQGV